MEIALGLGHLYNEHPDFIAMFKAKYHPDMPEFLEKAISFYCKDKILIDETK